jgi:DNA-binding response OmpR family regulator
VNFDKVSVNLETRNITVNSVKLHLTNKEYAILELLILRRDMVTKEELMAHLYTNSENPEVKIIDVFVCKLRKKLADASGGKNYIETKWGRGYALKEYLNENMIANQ